MRKEAFAKTLELLPIQRMSKKPAFKPSRTIAIGNNIMAGHSTQPLVIQQVRVLRLQRRHTVTMEHFHVSGHTHAEVEPHIAVEDFRAEAKPQAGTQNETLYVNHAAANAAAAKVTFRAAAASKVKCKELALPTTR